MFCWATDKRFAIKLSVSRAEDLMSAKVGKRLRPAPDRSFWEWLELTGKEDSWLELALEAYRYVSSVEHCGRHGHGDGH